MNTHTIATSWITLHGVHDRNSSCEISCVIHNPSDHHMRRWPLVWRADRGIFERRCAHGIGHPDPDQLPYWKRNDMGFMGVHGCDGCCIPHAATEGTFAL